MLGAGGIVESQRQQSQRLSGDNRADSEPATASSATGAG